MKRRSAGWNLSLALKRFDNGVTNRARRHMSSKIGRLSVLWVLQCLNFVEVLEGELHGSRFLAIYVSFDSRRA